MINNSHVSSIRLFKFNNFEGRGESVLSMGKTIQIQLKTLFFVLKHFCTVVNHNSWRPVLFEESDVMHICTSVCHVRG